jgi:hypothetical protein
LFVCAGIAIWFALNRRRNKNDRPTSGTIISAPLDNLEEMSFRSVASSVAPTPRGNTAEREYGVLSVAPPQPPTEGYIMIPQYTYPQPQREYESGNI